MGNQTSTVISLPPGCENIFGGGQREAHRCALCLIPLQVDTPTTTHTSCSYVACRDCWTEWAARDPGGLSCPLCRASLAPTRIEQARNEAMLQRERRLADRRVRFDAACDARAQADIAELHYRLRDLTDHAPLDSAIEKHVKLRMASARCRLIDNYMFDVEREEDYATFERSPHLFSDNYLRMRFGIGPNQSFEPLRAMIAADRAARDEKYQRKLERFAQDMLLAWSPNTNGLLRSGRAFREVRGRRHG